MKEAKTLDNNASSTPSPSVLLADDDPAVRAVTTLLLQHMGYEVWTAEDGPAALALFEERVDEIDVVLTDISMPLMSGASLISSILKQKPTMPFIACSGKAREDYAADPVLSSVRIWLKKPYDGAQLSEAIQVALLSTSTGA